MSTIRFGIVKCSLAFLMPQGSDLFSNTRNPSTALNERLSDILLLSSGRPTAGPRKFRMYEDGMLRLNGSWLSMRHTVDDCRQVLGDIPGECSFQEAE